MALMAAENLIEGVKGHISANPVNPRSSTGQIAAVRVSEYRATVAF